MPQYIDTGKRGEARVRELMEQLATISTQDSEWTNILIPHLTLQSINTSGPHPTLTFLFTVQPIHTNRLGNLHGGCTATLFDLTTSTVTALVSRPGFFHLLGVSRTLNTTYLRPAPVGTKVLIECELLQVGRRLCTIRGTMRQAEGEGLVLAICEHGKVNTDPEGAKWVSKL